jgi:cell division protein YceG involved in septum cleavage
MEIKTLNIISIIVVIALLIVGWFYVFTYGKANKEGGLNNQEEINLENDQSLSEEQQNDQILIEDTCSRFPDSPICNPSAESLSQEELEQNDQQLIEDTCSRYPDSPICQ